MMFALPLALGLMIAGGLFLMARFRLRGSTDLPEIIVKAPDRRGRLVMIVFFVTVAAPVLFFLARDSCIVKTSSASTGLRWD